MTVPPIEAACDRSATRCPPPWMELIGNTPLLRLGRITAELPRGVELYAKAEWYNPGGSVKDRAGAAHDPRRRAARAADARAR